MGLLTRIRRPRAAPATAQPDPRCTAVTRAGARCRLPAAPGDVVCVLHRGTGGPRTPAAA